MFSADIVKGDVDHLQGVNREQGGARFRSSHSNPSAGFAARSSHRGVGLRPEAVPVAGWPEHLLQQYWTEESRDS
jgi:hypothetical protein